MRKVLTPLEAAQKATKAAAKTALVFRRRAEAADAKAAAWDALARRAEVMAAKAQEDLAAAHALEAEKLSNK